MGIKINGFILSAGLSSRMKSFKPLLNFDGKSFIISIVEKFIPVCEKIGVVTGFQREEVENEINKYALESNLNKIQIIHNPDYETGMFSSFKAGLKELSECDWLLYHFVDQPHLPNGFYPEFVNQIEIGFDWIQPEYNQKKGHPILINRSLFPKILDSKITSLKEISYSVQINKKIWACNYKQVNEDIDTKEDYLKLI